MAKAHTRAARGISKRSFLSAVTAGAVGLAASAPGRAAAADAKPWDLIVVGGGTAGLPAAIFAAQRGARVLIVEAAGQVGGTLFLSSGQMSAAGTKLQKSKGISDTAQSHYDDIMRISKGTANPDIVRLAVFNAADTFDWLVENGLMVHPAHPVTGTTHEPYSAARYAWGTEGGMSILAVLERQLQPHIDSKKVMVLTSTEAVELVKDAKGGVTGVVTKDEKGAFARHAAHNVLLSAGGYASNSQMFAELEGAKDYSDVSYPYSQGAGIKLGVAVGGYVRGGEHHMPLFGGVMRDTGIPSPMIVTMRPWPPDNPPWGIYVNVNGKRFLREDIPSHDAHEEALRVQPDERCWVVFDSEILDKAPPFIGRWTKQEVMDAVGYYDAFARADTLEGLAKAAGVDAAGLAATVAAYNAGQKAGRDALGRVHMPLPLVRAPFYAVRLQSWVLSTFAGLAVDKDLRVIRQDGAPIPNLFAAGELIGAGATMGRSYCGGMLVTPALTFGRLLGQKMLKFSA
ncbi:MAG: FAD-dependent oxidoreductase [Rhodospirillaceae bacterium]|nr:FAD-dependent oxidoreductase [Rhodospirillaceae bacterium]